MARVLLVEDHLDQLEVRKAILEASGHEVNTASTAEEAIAKAPGCGIMVLDLIPNCAAVLAALSEQTRVIVLSGRDAPRHPRIDHVLKKPCSSKNLLTAIAQLSGLPLVLFVYQWSVYL